MQGETFLAGQKAIHVRTGEVAKVLHAHLDDGGEQRARTLSV